MLDLELFIAKQKRRKILTRHAMFDFFEDSVNMWEFDQPQCKKNNFRLQDRKKLRRISVNPPLHLSSWTLQAIRPTLANYERQETTTRLIMRPRKPISYCVDDGIGLGKLKRRLESSNLADLGTIDFELCC